ncbi:uncharacterized protein TRIADDRAFT_57210 [Trichoplax adhaerens]|uniref:Phospholipid/glycerol acyltransferase domain-containing protein n=1 Tax=Trichoplax adhaerens TaxID=10228 RepID=B3RYT7_TRIAD|nr:hypothetical protein TRIADDRAFT_57210 [Trichoplax adhaerens]EDV24083.1 hypothetical protein TRIADDRAFT_57210 [Trichoplax adhaerens]|eukprot:XP_002113609.1 hypothetical protein TRIADDRAFT_57210 [Trichoplax adhaerens]
MANYRSDRHVIRPGVGNLNAFNPFIPKKSKTTNLHYEHAKLFSPQDIRNHILSSRKILAVMDSWQISNELGKELDDSVYTVLKATFGERMSTNFFMLIDSMYGAHVRIVQETGQSLDDVKATVNSYIQEIEHRQGELSTRVMLVFMTKVICRIVEEISVNKSGINELKAVMQDSPVILAPVHRSYADFILVSYVLRACGVPIPAIVAGQDFSRMAGVSIILRRCGAFFMRRSFLGKDRLYWTIFNEYLTTILCYGDLPVEIFVEGTRSRTGKSLPPKRGLLKEAARSYFECKVPDIKICPISITYEKGLLKARTILSENFGKIHVHFGHVISMRDYCQQFEIDRSIHTLHPRHYGNDADPESHCVKQLSYHLIDRQRENLLLTGCALLSTIILQHDGGLQFDDAVAEVQWLRTEIARIRGDIAILGGEKDDSCNVKRALGLMHEVLRLTSDGLIVVKSEYNNSNKALKGSERPLLIYDAVFATAADHVVLARHRNKILHLFALQGLLAVVLWNESKAGELPVNIDVALENFQLLNKLFNDEFVITCDDKYEEAFHRAIRLLRESNVSLNVSSSSIHITSEGHRLVEFLCELIRPFIVAYWITCQYVLTNLDGHLEFSLKASCQGAQQLAIDYINGGLSKYYEVLSLSLYSNAFKALHDCDVIKKSLRNDKEVISINKLKKHSLIMIFNKLAEYGNLKQHEKSKLPVRIYSKY